MWASGLHKTAEKVSTMAYSYKISVISIMLIQLRISESINFESMKAFKESMSSVVSWIQEGQIPSRRADMLRTLNVSICSIITVVAAAIPSYRWLKCFLDY